MSNKKLGLKALGLSFLAALALSAFAAAGAQAATWNVAGASLGHGTKTILGLGGAGSLIAVGLNIECAHSTFSGLIHELDRGLATVQFTGCNFLEGSPPTTLSEVCAITAPDGDPNQGKITANVKFLATEDTGHHILVLFEPDVASGELNNRTFTTVEVVDAEEGSEECVLGGPKTVKGTQLALVLGGELEGLSHELHAVANGTDFLHIGANPAGTLTASASVHLNSDENWSFR